MSGILIAVLIVLVFVPGGARADSVTVTSPNGGESWWVGATQNITWTYTGDWAGKSVRIQLLGGGAVNDIVSNTAPLALTGPTGSYPWHIGEYLGGTAGPGTNYRIRVRVVGTSILDDSNNNFSILQFKLLVPMVVIQPKPDLKVSVNLSPTTCGNQAGTTCRVTSWINFPVTVSNTGPGTGTVDGTLMWRLYLYFHGPDGTGRGNRIDYWEDYTGVPSANGGTRTFTRARDGRNLNGHDYGPGKYKLKADIDQIMGGAVAETNEGNNTHEVEFWVR